MNHYIKKAEYFLGIPINVYKDWTRTYFVFVNIDWDPKKVRSFFNVRVHNEGLMMTLYGRNLLPLFIINWCA